MAGTVEKKHCKNKLIFLFFFFPPHIIFSPFFLSVSHMSLLLKRLLNELCMPSSFPGVASGTELSPESPRKQGMKCM